MVAAVTNLWHDWHDSDLGLKNCIGFRLYWPWFAWIANWMGWKFHGTGHQCMGRQVRGLQNARAHSKCVGPRKMRGPTPSARAALWVRGTQSARTHAKCVGRGSIFCGPHWVRGPQLLGEVSGPHCPLTSPAPAMQWPRNATAVQLAWAAMSRNRPAR